MKKIKCKNCGDDDDPICSICGYCTCCHRDRDVKESCASYLVDEKSDIFEHSDSDENPSIFKCLSCGTDKFIVGYTYSYETSIKCPTCGFEVVVHDG
ncbi:hypothetical protein KAR91_67135 [Candidatus Pacearchaeota archaeon]|nr:hypothetical protein [Candidatus Pacearchaeota archaeon]